MPADGRQGPIGLIAGNGAFPKLFARGAARAGHRVVAVAHRGETAPDLIQEVDALTWVRVGQLGAILKTFKRAGVQQAAMAGGIDKRRLLSHFRPDVAGLRLLWRLARRRDDAMLKALAGVFEAHGIRIIPSTAFVPEVLTPVGLLGHIRPSAAARRDLAEGLRLAHAIGALDVGQTVALTEGTVVALEALEGTDGCIERAGALTGGRGVVIVKAAKPGQDMRFDVPTIGPKTVATAAAAGVVALGLEAGRTLILQANETIEAANRAGMALVGLDGGC
jgi:DUF1009 family protein